jgi:hypothetical protein
MHRVKRPSPEAKSLGFSQIHSRSGHDLPGGEPKAKVIKRNKSGTKFQLNAAGGPLGEEFADET